MTDAQNDEARQSNVSEDLSDAFTDSREKLEADIRKLYSYSTSTLIYPTSPKKTTDYIKSVSVDTVLGWLDRQAAITERECRERAEKIECDCDCCRWQDERDELQARLEKSHRDWLVDVGEYERIVDGMKKQIAELKAENTELQSRLEAQERETACQSADYVAEQKRSIELQAQVESLENMASSYERRIEALEAERDELQAQADEKWNMYVATHEKVDELQAQLDNSMPLPLDADGVPIHVGDKLVCEEGKFAVNGIAFYRNEWRVIKELRVSKDGKVGMRPAKECRHVKRDPLMELAIDLMRDGVLADVPRSEWDVRATEVARLIREALKEVGDD